MTGLFHWRPWPRPFPSPIGVWPSRTGTNKWDPSLLHSSVNWVSILAIFVVSVVRLVYLPFYYEKILLTQHFLCSGFHITVKFVHTTHRTLSIPTINMALEEVSSAKCFGGFQKVFKHDRSVLHVDIQFEIYFLLIVYDFDSIREEAFSKSTWAWRCHEANPVL